MAMIVVENVWWDMGLGRPKVYHRLSGMMNLPLGLDHPLSLPGSNCRCLSSPRGWTRGSFLGLGKSVDKNECDEKGFDERLGHIQPGSRPRRDLSYFLQGSRSFHCIGVLRGFRLRSRVWWSYDVPHHGAGMRRSPSELLSWTTLDGVFPSPLRRLDREKTERSSSAGLKMAAFTL